MTSRQTGAGVSLACVTALAFAAGAACSSPGVGSRDAGGAGATAGVSASMGGGGTSAAGVSGGAGAGTSGAAGVSPVGADAGPTSDARSDALAPTDAGSVPETSAPRDAGAGGSGAVACAPAYPTPTGATIDLRPPMTLASVLATAQAGDRVVVHAGTYAKEQLSKRKFASFVSIEAATGEVVTFAGATFTSCDHLAFRDVKFSATVMLDGSSNFTFDGVTLDGGATEDAALQIHGQGSAGASHDVLVENSTIRGGGRTIFVLGVFAPSDGWNHHLTFVRDDITCGSHNCFQISGGRDLVIDGNRINGTTSAGVLTAGATRVAITRNRFLGTAGMSPAATQIATPGAEWDNYAGVENMISSAIVIANNVVTGWDVGVQLDASRDVAIVYDTVADGTGVRFNHRVPHDQQGNVILDKNENVRVWDDIVPSVSVATGETGPAFEANDVIWKGGGMGAGLVTTAPTFVTAPANTAGAFALAPGSVGLDAALVNAETPLVDLDGHLRGDKPDIGARELGATAPACP